MANTLSYIDPASTALIWQILAGIFISLGVVFGVFWRRITTFFKSLWVKLFRKKNGQENEKTEVDESVLELEDNDTAEEKSDSEIVEGDVEKDSAEIPSDTPSDNQNEEI